MYKCIHFGIKELVSKIVYDKFGESAWMFFDEDVLKDLDTIREVVGHSIIINNWGIGGGNLSQCGLRTNMDPLVKEKKSLYISSHMMGKGFDLHDGLGYNDKLWSVVYDLIRTKKLRKFKRLENKVSTPTWVHVDSYQSSAIIF